MPTPRLLPPDSAHGARLPSGRDLADLLRRFQLRQRSEALAAVRQGSRRIDLSRWAKPLAEAVTPHLYQAALWGATQTARRIMTRRRRRKGLEQIVGNFGLSWDLFNRRILEAVQQAALAFAQSTLDTATERIEDAIRHTREALAEGLEQGEGVRQIARRIVEVFGDRRRALMIAQTESSRATHAGQLLAARESGVVKGLRWLASSNACPKCLELSGKIVALGEPFVIDGTGPYARVEYPPLHPHCRCTVLEVLS